MINRPKKEDFIFNCDFRESILPTYTDYHMYANALESYLNKFEEYHKGTVAANLRLNAALDYICNEMREDYRFNADRDAPKYNWTIEQWKEDAMNKALEKIESEKLNG